MTATSNNELTAREQEYRDQARACAREVYALEQYSHLWDSLDARLGGGNTTTKQYCREYWNRTYDPPRDAEEARRVYMMRASFYLPRTGMPAEVVLALILSR